MHLPRDVMIKSIVSHIRVLFMFFPLLFAILTCETLELFAMHFLI
jgi:hypothetical protein